MRLPRGICALGLSVALLVGCASTPSGDSGCAAPRPARTAQRPAGSAAPRLGRDVAKSLPPPHSTPSAQNPPRVVPRPRGASLRVPTGFRVGLFAEGLSNPREMSVAPNGDIFVAESRANRLRVLRDADGDGKPEVNQVFIRGLRQPFGIAFHQGYLYIGNTDAVVRLPYRTGQLKAAGRPERITDLPGGGYNQHWTRNVVIDPRTNKVYVSVGSASNTSEEPLPRAAILEMNPDGSGRRVYASGLRNAVGLDINPATRQLWAAVNERDGLGDDVPPDYLTSIKPGGFYGWPYAYMGGIPDPDWGDKRPDLVKKTLMPDVPIQAHSAALGLAFYTGRKFPPQYRGDAFVALHGSWNRSRRVGYKVIRVDFEGGKPVSKPQDFVSGWLTGSGQVWGRPVGVAVTRQGDLLISDDGGNKIWRVSYASR